MTSDHLLNSIATGGLPAFPCASLPNAHIQRLSHFSVPLKLTTPSMYFFLYDV